jgi:hypothetical protein
MHLRRHRTRQGAHGCLLHGQRMPGPLVHAGARCQLRSRRLTTRRGQEDPLIGRGPAREPPAGAARAPRAPGRRAGKWAEPTLPQPGPGSWGTPSRGGNEGGQESPGSVRDNSLLLKLGKVQQRHMASLRRLVSPTAVSSHTVFICWQWALTPRGRRRTTMRPDGIRRTDSPGGNLTRETPLADAGCVGGAGQAFSPGAR